MPPKPKDPEAKAAAKVARKAKSRETRQQFFQAFKMQRKEDKWLIPLMVLVFLLSAGVIAGIGFLIGGLAQWITLPLALGIGVLAAMILFGRRVQRSVYKKADGQPGAAAWALQNMRGRRWKTTPAIAATTQLDAVHRVIGLPGVILVGEGAPHRVKPLLGQEKKRIARVVGKTPIYDVIVGNEEGQVPISRLQKHLAKLPRNVTAKQVEVLETRLASLGARGAQLPKGPMPAGAKMKDIQRTIRRR